MHSGPRTKLTEAVAAALIGHIREGQFLSVAAGLIGVHRVTVLRWLERGERYLKPDNDGNVPELPTDPEELLYVTFAETYRLAEAEALAEATREVVQGGKGWKPRAWWLEKRAPDVFGKAARLELTGPDGGPLQHQVKVDPVALAQRIASLAPRGASGAPRAASPGGAPADEPGGAAGDRRGGREG